MKCSTQTLCPCCGEALIHRDARGPHESSSALGQIMHREGPARLTVGDIDLYVAKWEGADTRLRIFEHKQPFQPLGRAQEKALTSLDAALKSGTLLDGSGVFVLRGAVGASKYAKTDFISRQTVTAITGETVLEPKTRRELFDWINGGPDWQPRYNRGRWW